MKKIFRAIEALESMEGGGEGRKYQGDEMRGNKAMEYEDDGGGAYFDVVL